MVLFEQRRDPNDFKRAIGRSLSPYVSKKIIVISNHYLSGKKKRISKFLDPSLLQLVDIVKSALSSINQRVKPCHEKYVLKAKLIFVY